MDGYNDDLVMAMGIALWIRDVALRLRKDSDTIMKTILTRLGSSSNDNIKSNFKPLMTGKTDNPYGIAKSSWEMQIRGGEKVDLTWLIQK